jgi:hypothetical protein
LRQNYVVAADTNHFFKRRFDHDVVDMGDAVWSAARDGLFGDSFSHTYESYIASLRGHPPDIVLTTAVSGPPMLEFVRNGYTFAARVFLPMGRTASRFMPGMICRSTI